ncbi:MAG: hypothetical protein EOO77_28440 [Oxalobacteraceae bacterium]|nr:MAG: hypothetical protein EOO77_28440 [Oxalobacteraceae bacterium]
MKFFLATFVLETTRFDEITREPVSRLIIVEDDQGRDAATEKLYAAYPDVDSYTYREITELAITEAIS